MFIYIFIFAFGFYKLCKNDFKKGKTVYFTYKALIYSSLKCTISFTDI